MSDTTAADDRHEAWKAEYRAWRKYAEAYRQRKDHLPLVMHQEVYRYFGNRCQIVEANIFDRVANAEVTIEGPFGERQTLQFAVLDLEFFHGVDDSE